VRKLVSLTSQFASVDVDPDRRREPAAVPPAGLLPCQPGYITWAVQLGIALDADSLDASREATKRVYVEVPRFMGPRFSSRLAFP
jgi:hypothetical protein